MTIDISDRLLAYLRSWHATSTTRQATKGVIVELSFEQFLALIDKRQLRSLQAAIDANRIRSQMDETNPYAFVLTWKSYAACSTRRLNPDTACVCSRMKSRQLNMPQQGDTLRLEHRRAISRKLTGVPKSEDHRKAISDASKGVSRAKWTDERRAERRQLLADKRATRGPA